jgi:hypothetical protein
VRKSGPGFAATRCGTTKSGSIGRLNGRISGSLEVVPAFLRLKQIADVTERSPERIKGASFGFAQVRFYLREGLFDRFAMVPLNGCFLLTFSLMA